MPRRNRNAQAHIIDTDDLAAETRQLVIDLTAIDVTATSRCAGCRANPAADGDYCLLCKGQIISSARKHTVKRR